MNTPIIDISKAGLGNYKRSKSKFIEGIWMITEIIFITNPLQISSRIRIFFLKLFGSNIGENVIIRPRVRIKYPWNLALGSNCWIGEGVWIHNQDKVIIGDNSVVSQEAFITTGSHDIYSTMNLTTKPVIIDDGVWITSRCIILQGVRITKNVVVTPGSVVHKSIPYSGIYSGNPVRFIKERKISSREGKTDNENPNL